MKLPGGEVYACEFQTLNGSRIEMRVDGRPPASYTFTRPAAWAGLEGLPPDHPDRSPYTLYFTLESIVGRRAYYREVKR